MNWIQDKRVVVTGATSGVGKEVARALAAQGAQVVLACRDRVRAEQVAAEINGSLAEPRATAMTVDTSDPRSIRAFASQYRDAYGALEVLVNNAGVLLADRQVNVDGIELTFATNVLGYYLVTSELLDALRAGSARVVNVASTFAFGLDLDDLQFERRPYDGMAAYAQSKACDRLLTWALARRLENEGITINAMAPGLVLDTDLYRSLSADTKRELEAYGTRTIEQGADTAVWLASCSDLAGVTGKFFEQRAEVACEFRDRAVEDRLWEACRHSAGRVETQR